MRKPILLLAFLCTGCQVSDDADYALIADFVNRATAARCTPVSLADDPAPTEIRLATDSTWTLLDAAGRRVLEVDDGLRVVATTEIPAAGPGAADEPVSAALLGDTAWAIAARGGLRLVVLSRTGAELAAEALDFIPHSVEATPGGELLLTAMPFGDRPPTLLVRWDGTGLAPLDAPRRPYEDMTVNALGNTALVETFPDGSALVVHQFLKPRGFRIDPEGRVEALRVPTPDATREHIEYVPRSPITDAQLPLTLLPAMAMAVDPRTSEVYLLTRSGRAPGGRAERAVLRLTDGLEFVEGFTLDVHAVGMVWLPRRELALVVDDQDRFYTCPLPRTQPRHARAD